MKILNAFFVAVAATSLGALSHAAPASPPMTPGEDTPKAVTIRVPQRFEFYIGHGLPPEYRGKVNPNLEPTVPVVLKGADIYNARCASCHGPMGFGNGVAAGRMRTKPADLAWSLSNPKVRDDFLYWTIAEGGAQFGSSMPAFKGDLIEPQIWQVITYLHAAFEGREAYNLNPKTKQASLSGRGK